MGGRAVLIRWIVVALITMASMVWAYQIITATPTQKVMLPVMGAKNADSTDHVIPSFSLINQDGRIITQDNFQNKVYVADFFFTNCEGICPRMSNQMERIAEHFKNVPEVALLSHSVKPDEDSIQQLKRYAIDHGADSMQWNFVRGTRKEINDLARHSYLLGADADTTDSDYFVHTQYFALVDAKKRIRGFYDGTDSASVNKLISDIDILLNESETFKRTFIE